MVNSTLMIICLGLIDEFCSFRKQATLLLICRDPIGSFSARALNNRSKRQIDYYINLTPKEQIKRNQIYKYSYSELKGITSSEIDAEHAYCIICGVIMSIARGVIKTC